jgi:hypothetical protein
VTNAIAKAKRIAFQGEPGAWSVGQEKWTSTFPGGAGGARLKWTHTRPGRATNNKRDAQ